VDDEREVAAQVQLRASVNTGPSLVNVQFAMGWVYLGYNSSLYGRDRESGFFLYIGRLRRWIGPRINATKRP